MTVTIRIQSPLLKRLLCPKRRIETLPRFSNDAPRLLAASPFAVWVSTIVTVLMFLSLAMVAGFEPVALAKLGGVGEGLVRQVAASSGAVQAPRPPEASFPYGSVPPMQSTASPATRPALAPSAWAAR